MGYLTKPPDPEGLGQPLGYRPIRNCVNQKNNLIAGGQRPTFVDGSRPGNEKQAGGMSWSWGRKREEPPPAIADTPPEKSLDEIQNSYPYE